MHDPDSTPATAPGVATPEEVRSFWLDELSPEDWYRQDDALDTAIRDRFLPTWEAARTGALPWLGTPEGVLAYLIVTDQFPRNMFRGDERSFATDRLALAAAKMAIDRFWDQRIPGPARQFIFMPLMHSECLVDQDRCVRLMMSRMEDGASNLLHAKVHREIIRRFGRFPYRNDALGRASRPDETRFLTEGGYGAILRALEAAA